ncbi:hypothetical protein CH367_03695 [Leptospira barantonii]|uniref:Uncharacterized protein n=1 Tax=Leptospira barantonii TaxID=2023184 RepID=A0ABX4NQL6_9LEPT|nr:hypothetical protein CH367_03695 [Leptospira barantonii]
MRKKEWKKLKFFRKKNPNANVLSGGKVKISFRNGRKPRISKLKKAFHSKIDDFRKKEAF